MTELEKLQRAKMYIDKLSCGINPLDGLPVPETDSIRQARISRCLSYVSGVFGRVIEDEQAPKPLARSDRKTFELSTSDASSSNSRPSRSRSVSLRRH